MIFKEKYILKNLINKAGINYSLNIGLLIGEKFHLEKEDLERHSDINLEFPKSFIYKIRIKIPDGYKVEGLDQINFTVDNEMGSFISLAKEESGYIFIQQEKN